MTSSIYPPCFLALVLLLLLSQSDAFCPVSPAVRSVPASSGAVAGPHLGSSSRVFMSTPDGGDDDTSVVTADEDGNGTVDKVSLEEKMKGWEASEEEIKAASLGGLYVGTPKDKGPDGFDVGLWIMFPFIVATSLLFFVFPFIMDKIDVSSVGPPPMV